MLFKTKLIPLAIALAFAALVVLHVDALAPVVALSRPVGLPLASVAKVRVAIGVVLVLSCWVTASGRLAAS